MSTRHFVHLLQCTKSRERLLSLCRKEQSPLKGGNSFFVVGPARLEFHEPMEYNGYAGVVSIPVLLDLILVSRLPQMKSSAWTGNCRLHHIHSGESR